MNGIIRKHTYIVGVISLLFFLLSAGWPVRMAFAVLGEDQITIETDRQKLSGVRETVAHAQYSVEAVNAAGIVVQEYVALNGTIFAVTWKGNKIPDLSSLFGIYFQEYEQAIADWRKQTPRRRGPLHLESAHLVIDTGGRSPNLWGRGFIPSLLPPGVSPEEIQ